MAAVLSVPSGAALAATPACGDAGRSGIGASAVFIEGAPTDRLEVRNISGDGWRISRIDWDLSATQGRLIFDVTSQGSGVEVFQPLRLVSSASAARVAGLPAVRDGDQTLAVEFDRFDPGQVVAFTMDLDDRLGQREITVADSEMTGATLRATLVRDDGAQRQLELVFGARARASACID